MSPTFNPDDNPPPVPTTTDTLNSLRTPDAITSSWDASLTSPSYPSDRNSGVVNDKPV